MQEKVFWQATFITGIDISLEDIMQNLFARIRNPALRQGLIYGIILGVVLLALSLIINYLIFILIICLLAAFLAGMRVSRETGRLTTGVLAGMWTGLFGILILVIISFILTLINIDTIVKDYQQYAISHHQQITYTPSLVITNSLISYAIIVVLAILFGVIGGAVGGSIGRRRALRLTPTEADEETFVESTASTPQDETPSASAPEEQTSSTPPAE